MRSSCARHSFLLIPLRSDSPSLDSLHRHRQSVTRRRRVAAAAAAVTSGRRRPPPPRHVNVSSPSTQPALRQRAARTAHRRLGELRSLASAALRRPRPTVGWESQRGSAARSLPPANFPYVRPTPPPLPPLVLHPLDPALSFSVSFRSPPMLSRPRHEFHLRGLRLSVGWEDVTGHDCRQRLLVFYSSACYLLPSACCARLPCVLYTPLRLDAFAPVARTASAALRPHAAASHHAPACALSLFRAPALDRKCTHD